MHINFSNLCTSLWSCTTNYKDTAAGPPMTVDSYYSDIVGHEVIGQCQSEVKVADTSRIHWVTKDHCWFILNVIADGSIRVEWGEPVQFNSTPRWCSNHGQHSRWGGGCGNINIMMKVHGVKLSETPLGRQRVHSVICISPFLEIHLEDTASLAHTHTHTHTPPILNLSFASN